MKKLFTGRTQQQGEVQLCTFISGSEQSLRICNEFIMESDLIVVMVVPGEK